MDGRDKYIKLTEALCSFDVAAADLVDSPTGLESYADVVKHASVARKVMDGIASSVSDPIKAEFYKTQPYKFFPEGSNKFLLLDLPQQVLIVLAASTTPLSCDWASIAQCSPHKKEATLAQGMHGLVCMQRIAAKISPDINRT